MSEPWFKWMATLGYVQHNREDKEIARIEFWAPNAAAAESYARRHAEALFDSCWGACWHVVGPIQ